MTTYLQDLRAEIAHEGDWYADPEYAPVWVSYEPTPPTPQSVLTAADVVEFEAWLDTVGALPVEQAVAA